MSSTGTKPAATPSPAAQLFDELVANLGADVVGQLKSVLKSAATNLEANPTTMAVMGQGILLQGALIAAVPTLESDGIKQGAVTLGKLVDLIPETASPVPSKPTA